MAYLDELRNTLLSRTKKPAEGQKPAEQAKEPMYGLTPSSGTVTSSAPVLGGSVAPDGNPVSQARTPSSLISGLQDAVSGRSGAGSSTPKTGMVPPAWSATPAPMGPGELPVGLPQEGAKVPPRWERFDTAQKMIGSVQDQGWSPQALMIRLLNGGR